MVVVFPFPDGRHRSVSVDMAVVDRWGDADAHHLCDVRVESDEVDGLARCSCLRCENLVKSEKVEIRMMRGMGCLKRVMK